MCCFSDRNNSVAVPEFPNETIATSHVFHMLCAWLHTSRRIICLGHLNNMWEVDDFVIIRKCKWLFALERKINT
jgi:hypothetical protein